MNKLYFKLMATNIKNGKQFYVPYILAGILTVILFYSMMAIYYNDGLATMPGGSNLIMIMNFGTKVIVIFSFIFIFYTNSFIMKRRKKDIGIYNILGMEKRHIAKEIFLENMVIAIIVIAGGLIIAIMFNKFFMMFLYKILRFETGIKFFVCGPAIRNTLAVFTILYLMTVVYNIMQVKLSNPIELLHGSNAGEKEPKTKVFMAVAGIICIGTGYYIAITTENPINALMLFFVAVVLVIAGTYFIFTAGSIAFLKMLRHNKNYYYNKKHFTAVSGLIYRMKQNAAGLANICILSTMVLVMLSTTVSLYIGEDDILKTRYVADINVTCYSEKPADREKFDSLVEKTVKDSGRKITKKHGNAYQSFVGIIEGNEFRILNNNDNAVNYNDYSVVVFITNEDFTNSYNYKTGPMQEDEVFVYGQPEYKWNNFKAFGQEFNVKKYVDFDDPDSMSDVVKECYYIIVKDEETLVRINEAAKAAYKASDTSMNYSFTYQYNLYIDIDGNSSEKKECGRDIINAGSGYIETLKSTDKKTGYTKVYTEAREVNREEFLSLYGGLFFLGIFLGSIFLMITVIIIFYKQISEGYDDKERFIIMEKVGMSKKDVKTSIRSQIKMVFLLPIAIAVVHVAAAFPMIRRLLLMFNMNNYMLYAKCVLVTILVFAAIYIAVFILTSRTYYKIVGNENR